MSKLSQNSSAGEILGGFSATRITLIVVGGAIVVGIAYFGIVKPVFEFVGIKDSKLDKQNQKIIEDGLKKPYWSPNHWRTNPSRLSYPESKYSSMAQQLYDATRGGFFGWGTAEEAIYGVFRQLPTSFDVSKLADVYQISNGEDLYQLINDELSTEELTILQKIINNTVK